MAEAQLQIKLGAIEFVGEGEKEWLSAQLDKILTLASSGADEPSTPDNVCLQVPLLCLDAESPTDLRSKIVGTTWRKKNGLDTIFFQDQSIFLHSSGKNTDWTENTCTLDSTLKTMTLTWRSDGFQAKCRFYNKFSRFVEEEIPECTWFLISK